MCYKLQVGGLFYSKGGSEKLCGMASAGGDATGWDDSGTDSPCPFLCSGDGDFWKELSGLTGGPLHSLVDHLQRVIMSYSRSLELVKQALERAGIDSTEYGTHSLRSGGTTAAARAHVVERLIQRHGGWKSASSKNCYISDSLEDALSVSRAVLQ